MFETLIGEAHPNGKRLTVYARDDETGVEERFGDSGVAIERRPLPPHGPDPFVAIHDGEEFAGALGLADFEELLAPPVVRPGDREAVSAGYRALFELLDETVFSSLDRRQLLGASREIEDRAFRVSHGVLRVSFQRPSAFAPQVDVYRHLAGRNGLDIHVYGVTGSGGGDPAVESTAETDWDSSDIEGLTFHETTAPVVEGYWALAFDGGIDERQACGLLARERDDSYTSFWTYDPETVGTILDDSKQPGRSYCSAVRRISPARSS
jgi:DICT domain-containing protein